MNLDWRRIRLLGAAGELSDSDDGDMAARRDERRKGRKRLPGAAQGTDVSARRTRPEVRVQRVHFAPTGTAFTAATTEGVLVYALAAVLDAATLFDPFRLGTDVTPASARTAIANANAAVAVQQSLTLNDDALIYAAVHLVSEPSESGFCSCCGVI